MSLQLTATSSSSHRTPSYEIEFIYFIYILYFYYLVDIYALLLSVFEHLFPY